MPSDLKPDGPQSSRADPRSKRGWHGERPLVFELLSSEGRQKIAAKASESGLCAEQINRYGTARPTDCCLLFEQWQRYLDAGQPFHCAGEARVHAFAATRVELELR